MIKEAEDEYERRVVIFLLSLVVLAPLGMFQLAQIVLWCVQHLRIVIK